MVYKKWLLASLLTTFLWSESIDIETLNGAWHLRVMDGMEVRKARAILDFDMKKMYLSGFDACNRISGALIKNSDTNMNTPILTSSKMACRGNIYNWVSQRLREVLKEGFSIIEETKYNVDGITLKSPKHELFFKRMEKD